MSKHNCMNINKLWRTTKELVNISDYSDEEWSEDYSADYYFAYVLTWAGWNERRQRSEWNRVKHSLDRCGGTLLGLAVSRKEPFSLPWQNQWLRRLADYLRSREVSPEQLVETLRMMGYAEAKAKLQEIVGSSAEKIIDCWIRDVVRIDCFPIDTRVRAVLQHDQIPVDSSIVLECCRAYKIPARIFARAVDDRAEELRSAKV